MINKERLEELRKKAAKAAKTEKERNLMPSFLGEPSLSMVIDDAIDEAKQIGNHQPEYEAPTVPLSVRVDERTAYQLEQYAKLLNRKKSDLLRAIIFSGVFDIGQKLLDEGMLDDAVEKLKQNNDTDAVDNAYAYLQRIKEVKEGKHD